MIIDAHQHVWDLETGDYPWLGPQHPQWNRTYSFEEARPQLRAAGVTASILVQAADNREDTALMFATADRHPEVVGVVAYVPLEDPATAAVELDALRRDDRLVGIRNLMHDRPDPDWVLRPDVDEGLGLLEAAGIPFDLVAVRPRHLEHVPMLGERHPDLSIVIDHLGKPPIGEDERDPWWSLIATAAENPQVTAKVSGLYPAANPARWTVAAVVPFVDRAVEVFGAERLMVGGDWPISVVAGGYAAVADGLRTALSGLTGLEAEAIWYGTAARVYRLDPARLDAARAAYRVPLDDLARLESSPPLPTTIKRNVPS